jgi:hypothetical protein
VCKPILFDRHKHAYCYYAVSTNEAAAAAEADVVADIVNLAGQTVGLTRRDLRALAADAVAIAMARDPTKPAGISYTT